MPHLPAPREEIELQALFDAMPQLGWAADADGWIYYYNRRWYEYTGTTAEQLKGWGWQAVHDPALLPEVIQKWNAALAAGQPFEMSFTLLRHDGARRWFLTRATPLRDERGKIYRWVGINTDIHEQREAQDRLKLLASLALPLSEARTRAQVVEIIVERGMAAAHADTCALYMLDDGRTALELIGSRGISPEIMSRIRRISAREGNPDTFASVQSGTTLWAESADDYQSLFPSLAKQEATGPRAQAFWSVPLIVEGRAVGLLGMGFYEPRRFLPDERAFVGTFSQQCGQALLRAVRLEREDEAQRALTTTLRSIGDGVIATDTVGRVTFMNPVAENLTGWAASDARGFPLDEVFRIFSEDTGEAVESPVTKVLREGTVVGLANHTVLLSKSGRRIPIDDSGAPIQDGSNAILGVVLVFRDATKEKLDSVRRAFLVDAGEALASSLDYRATLATVARLAVPRLADWCTVELIEPGTAASQQVAVSHADPAKVAFAREMGERYPPDPEARTGVPQVMRSGKSELYSEIPVALLEAGAKDAEHLRILRELRLESAMIVPLRGRDRTFGALTFIYADSGRHYTADDLAFAEEFARRATMAIETARAFRDVEEARIRERALRREAEIANRAKDEFLATVSHELRTPLNAILGWTVTLRRRNPPEEIERPLAVIERNARAQARLIEDVLDVSRIISGKLSLTLGMMNLADAIDGAIEAVTPAAEAKGIAIDVDIQDRALEITADAGRVQQVVWNLTSNAVKFTPKGGTISIKAYREGSDVYVRVNDTGEGIPAEVLPAVFEPFRQADASTTRRHGGLGLGLAIVKQLVAAHGGTVSATSDGPGSGAEFIVRLPARIDTIVPASSRLTPDASAYLAEAQRPSPRLDGLKLLVVDDEEDARVLLRAVLSLQGAEVEVAGSVEEALQAFERLRPDVVVSDIGMPVADGYALIRKIRALATDKGGRTPAIALTAYARAEDVQRAFAAGYQGHIAKPVEPAQIATIVANLGGRILDC
jgi:PAS domain S-box-containing protein